MSTRNAHPHTDCHGRIGVVHNGIIDNAGRLRVELEGRGHRFASDVDSEVIGHLVEEELPTAGLFVAVQRAVDRLSGSWAIAVLDAATGELVAAAHRSPLVFAAARDGVFIASDVDAIAAWIDTFQVLEDGDVVEVSATPQWHRHGHLVEVPRDRHCTTVLADMTLGLHPDFMAKEIQEQPEVAAQVLDAWAEHAPDASLWASFDLPAFRRVAVLGCGTSLNAGRAIGSVFGRLGGIAHQAIIASEAATTIIEPDTLVLALSQSGETADVLRALDLIQARGAPVLALTNSPHSALGRRANAVMACHAGPEIGVAATKTFTAQVLTGICVALSSLVASGSLRPTDAARLVEDLRRVPDLLAQAIGASQHAVPPLVAQFRDAGGYLFLGRGPGTVFADEGALKLKELSYRWAESFPAGELKHGPLALIEQGTPVVVVDGPHQSLAGSIAEVEARGGAVIRIGGPGSTIPALGVGGTGAPVNGLEWCGPLEAVVAMQIFARELALTLGRDVDKPRNLAKSVTVE